MRRVVGEALPELLAVGDRLAVQRAFTRIAFTEAVKAEQQARGTREFCADLELRQPNNDVLTPRAIAFIESVDTAFVSTCSHYGWPYVQHRGGQRGFIRVLGLSTIAFDDFDGNRQFITLGNLRENARIMLILIDFERQARLKIWGRAHVVEQPLPPLPARSAPSAIRHIVVDVEAWDFNCSKHIARRSRPFSSSSALSPAEMEALPE